MATVLIIDDSFELGSSLSEILDSAGHNVVLTVEPKRALELCSEINFDLIMCDLCLHDSPAAQHGSLITGMDMLWKLVDQYPRLPIIAMGQNIDKGTTAAMQKLGIYGTVVRPMQHSEILHEVERALAKKDRSSTVAQIV